MSKLPNYTYYIQKQNQDIILIFLLFGYQEHYCSDPGKEFFRLC